MQLWTKICVKYGKIFIIFDALKEFSVFPLGFLVLFLGHENIILLNATQFLIIQDLNGLFFIRQVFLQLKRVLDLTHWLRQAHIFQLGYMEYVVQYFPLALGSSSLRYIAHHFSHVIMYKKFRAQLIACTESHYFHRRYF